MMIMIMSENQLSQSQVHVTAFQGTEVKCQEASLNRRPIAYTAGGGSVLTQHQSRDTETGYGQHNTHDGSSGRPSALLEISCFTRECSTPNFTIIILGLGKTTNSQDRFPTIQL
jgi:hypothetical protein